MKLLTVIILILFISVGAEASEKRFRITVDKKPATCFIVDDSFVFFCVRDKKILYRLPTGHTVYTVMSKEEKDFRREIK